MVDEHTPEPWEKNGTNVAKKGTGATSGWPIDYDLIANLFDDEYIANPNAEQDARRIVACVNACAGIPTAALEHAAKTYRIDADRLWRMEKLFKAAFKGVTEQ